MATNMINYVKHGVAESSKIKATECGHIINLLVDEDNGIDNGSFVSFDIADANIGHVVVAGDIDVLGKTKVPAKEDEVYLVLSVPMIYEDYTPKMREEANFYNGKGEIARCYEIVKGDCFGLSQECFSNPESVGIGKYISIDGTGHKAVVSDDVPTDTAFVGYIYARAANGNWYVYVTKNKFGDSGEADPVKIYFSNIICYHGTPTVEGFLLDGDEIPAEGVVWSSSNPNVTFDSSNTSGRAASSFGSLSSVDPFVVTAHYKDKDYSINVTSDPTLDNSVRVYAIINDQVLMDLPATSEGVPQYHSGDVLRVRKVSFSQSEAASEEHVINWDVENMELLVLAGPPNQPSVIPQPVKIQAVNDSLGPGYVIVNPVPGNSYYWIFGTADGYPVSYGSPTTFVILE